MKGLDLGGSKGSWAVMQRSMVAAVEAFRGLKMCEYIEDGVRREAE